MVAHASMYATIIAVLKKIVTMIVYMTEHSENNSGFPGDKDI